MTNIITREAQIILAAAGAVIISLGAAYEAGLRVGVSTPMHESNIASVVLYKVN